MRHEDYLEGLERAVALVKEVKGPAQQALEQLQRETGPAAFAANEKRLKLLDRAAEEEHKVAFTVASRDFCEDAGIEPSIYAGNSCGQLKEAYRHAGLVPAGGEPYSVALDFLTRLHNAINQRSR